MLKEIGKILWNEILNSKKLITEKETNDLMELIIKIRKEKGFRYDSVFNSNKNI
ncbi:hypothetical protein HYV50_01670 [Candidatus Pacearchaeota archaeon]|nr:hypothetical protein [Candidatus Pacearchaeota archaeon]